MMGASDAACSFALALKGCARAGTVISGCSPAAETAEPPTALLRGGEGTPGALADHPGLKLGDARHLLQDKASGCGSSARRWRPRARPGMLDT